MSNQIYLQPVMCRKQSSGQIFIAADAKRGETLHQRQRSLVNLRQALQFDQKQVNLLNSKLVSGQTQYRQPPQLCRQPQQLQSQ